MAVISRGPTLGEQVYAHVRDRIVSGEYKAGQVLNESELAHELRVSRTPVSNAIIMLKERGLLEESNGKPAVPRLALKDVIDLYRCRLALDGLAARLAAIAVSKRDLADLEKNLRVWKQHAEEDDSKALWVADLEFHSIVYRASGNKHLMRFAQIATEQAAVYRRNTIIKLDAPGERTPRRGRSDVYSEHTRIFEALEARDPERAAEMSEQHIENVIRHLEGAEVRPDTEA